MNKQTTTIIIGVVLIIVAFFGGKAYGSKHPSAGSAQALQGGNGQFARGNFGGGFGGRNGAGATMGQVVAKDATSITVSIPNGGSKIVLYSPSTTVAKSVQGSISDVTVGETITAIGSANSDGSVTANTIQIRPAGAAGMQSRQTSAPMIPAQQ